MKHTIYAVIASGIFATSVSAFTASIQIDNQSFFGPELQFRDTGNAPLDGTIIELGIFSTDTSTFDGTWSPLTSFNFGTAGESGHFASGLLMIDSTIAPYTVGARYALRIYDAAGNFNTVTDTGDPNWLLPAASGAGGGDPLPIFTSLAPAVSTPSPNLAWEQPASPFVSAIAIPEPSSILLSGLGLLALAGRRKRA